MVTNILHINKTGLLISIKNGAWFESPSERGFTHLAEYCIQRLTIDQCEAAGVDMQSFCVQGETTLDRVRFAIFFAPNDAERVVSIVLECVKNPPFTMHSIRQEMRELRGDFIDSYKNPYFRAGLAIIPHFIKKNSSVFGSVWFHLFARGPVPERLRAYWQKLLSASSCDVLTFGVWDDAQKNIVNTLSTDAHPTVPAAHRILERHSLREKKYTGVLWQESCLSPLYALLDTVMDRRAEARAGETRLLTVNRGLWCGYVLLGGSVQEWQNVFSKEVSLEEWQGAKLSYKFFIERVLSGVDIFDDIFYWDDCTSSSYASHVTSLSDLNNIVHQSSYEEFQRYWSQTIGA